MRVVATAGHVDHGKSALVLALTGTDPDRFAEEKTRGLTIDLGFAFTTLPSGLEVGFVDVPGHIHFIKNMLAGVGAVEVVVLVVAANEGWMPQSEEHLRIVELLGVRHGLVVITKADTVDDETLELARLEVDERLAGSALADAPVVPSDARSGRGLDDVRTALAAVLEAAPVAVDRGRPRLWIDRVFTVKGAGTVVTGTLAGGSLAVDDEVEVGAPARGARIRGVETAHRAVARASPGARVALNLVGVDPDALHRGDAIVRPGQWLPAEVVDVALQPLPGNRMLRRATLQCHVGSGEHAARMRVLDEDGRYARLRLPAPVPLVPGDRIVLRDAGREATVGGAEILDISPPGRAADAPPRLGLAIGERMLRGREWVARSELGALTGRSDRERDDLVGDLVTSGAAAESEGWLIESAELARVLRATRERVTAHHDRRPHDRGLTVPAVAREVRIEPDQLRAAVACDSAIAVAHGVVRLAHQNGRVADRPEAVDLVAALAAEPFSPPDPASVGGQPELVRALVREGALVDLDGLVFTAGAVADARQRVGAALRTRGSVTVADVRDLLGSTRRYVVPILAYLDAQGVTRRRGDDRIAGPGAPG